MRSYTKINVGQQELKRFRRGFSRQSSAIAALVFKEFKVRIGKSRIGLFWVLFEPAIGMAMISGIWYAMGREYIHDVHVTLYIASGFIVFNTARQGLGYLPSAIDANQALLNYPQVKPIDTIIARFIQGIWLHTWSSIIIFFGIWWILRVYPNFPDPLLAIEAIAVAMVLAFGVSLPLAVLGTLNNELLKFVGIVSSPLMILSGVMYSVNEMPLVVQFILSYNPILHLVEGFRAGAFGIPLFRYFDLIYPLKFGCLGLGFGCALYYRYRFKLLTK